MHFTKTIAFALLSLGALTFAAPVEAAVADPCAGDKSGYNKAQCEKYRSDAQRASTSYEKDKDKLHDKNKEINKDQKGVHKTDKEINKDKKEIHSDNLKHDNKEAHKDRVELQADKNKLHGQNVEKNHDKYDAHKDREQLQKDKDRQNHDIKKEKQYSSQHHN